MRTNHVVIWIDHREAHVLYFDTSKNQIFKSNSSHQHLHHKANTIGSGNAPKDPIFFNKLSEEIAQVSEILIVGPGSAKTEFVKYMKAHHHTVAQKIVGVEVLDHPSDKEVLAYAKQYFQKIDQLKGL